MNRDDFPPLGSVAKRIEIRPSLPDRQRLKDANVHALRVRRASARLTRAAPVVETADASAGGVALEDTLGFVRWLDTVRDLADALPVDAAERFLSAARDRYFGRLDTENWARALSAARALRATVIATEPKTAWRSPDGPFSKDGW